MLVLPLLAKGRSLLDSFFPIFFEPVASSGRAQPPAASSRSSSHQVTSTSRSYGREAAESAAVTSDMVTEFVSVAGRLLEQYGCSVN